MADSAVKQVVDDLKSVGDALKNGHRAGDSLQSLRDGQLKNLGGSLNNFADAVQAQSDLKVAMLGIGPVGNDETGAAQFIAPVPCEIVGLRVSSRSAITGDPLLTADVKPTGESAVNLLAAANYDMAGLTTAKQSAALTLTATLADRLLAAGEVATFLVTSDANDEITDASIMVLYKHTA